ncbi:saccharopine dehydrogenase [Sphingomonas sp. Leaf231]|uniref:saccharopine dehydrogenase family protein n=1 Tax=Sphingomonas sp. Leaf231 TaxID=1736301 RepID=UPI0006F9C4AD|nr:saccharopine dehydrogenase NADP-binding domain-containing protein [Sphingomonas sp. Leaf231]KQN92914.1 saccharopine dehydrogenase [Sphingomonas sp. Leaf231]
MADDFDIVLFGATGFTGGLVAEYIASRYDGQARWALAGRSAAKLAKVREALGVDVPLLVADSDDARALRDMCSRTRVVISTVGPYQLHGSALIAACAETGTAYVDLCGEPGWMRLMIDAHHDEAKRSGARIVFSCGFDSIPFDLGVLTLQEAAVARFGQPVPRVKARVRRVKGGFSGGTVASLKATLAAAARQPSLLGLLTDPFALTPGHAGPHQPAGLLPEYDATLQAWVAPFIMAPINTKNVHRTNFLLGQSWGDLVYDEMVVTGLGDLGKAAAEAMAKLNPFAGDKGPKPGEGPSRAERDAGHFDILFAGLMPDGSRLDTVVTGDSDPGYGCTSRMLAESALCLIRDVQGEGGIWTPGALMGTSLRDRLVAHAGMTFTAG